MELTVEKLIKFLVERLDDNALNSDSAVCIVDYGDGVNDGIVVQGIAICSLGLEGEPFLALSTSEF